MCLVSARRQRPGAEGQGKSNHLWASHSSSSPLLAAAAAWLPGTSMGILEYCRSLTRGSPVRCLSAEIRSTLPPLHMFKSSTSLFSSRISSHGRRSRAGPALVLCRTMAGATTFSRRATPSAAGITQEIPIQGTARASCLFPLQLSSWPPPPPGSHRSPMQFSKAYNFLAGGIPASCADHAGGAWLNNGATGQD